MIGVCSTDGCFAEHESVDTPCRTLPKLPLTAQRAEYLAHIMGVFLDRSIRDLAGDGVLVVRLAKLRADLNELRPAIDEWVESKRKSEIA